MMGSFTERAQAIAREAVRKRVQEVADRLRPLFGEGAIEVGEGRISVRGRGLVRRWLVDPQLRFFRGE